MKPEEQRIAIAEALGYDTNKFVLGGVYAYKDPQGNIVGWLPDYLDSLDAMADAQQKLYSVEGGWVWYLRELHDVIAKKRGTEFTDAWTLLDATAAEKAEAFLRALGLWRKEEP